MYPVGARGGRRVMTLGAARAETREYTERNEEKHREEKSGWVTDDDDDYNNSDFRGFTKGLDTGE